MSLKKHIIGVFSFLNERAEYAVLRNYQGLPDDNASRDIDIIITRKGLQRIKRELVEVLCDDGWRIVTYLNSDRLVTFVCAKNVEHETEIVQWDFFVNTSVWGVELMSAEEFLTYRVWNGFLWHVDVVGEFLDKYLYNRAVGANYPAKYESIRTQITDSVPSTSSGTGNGEQITECLSLTENISLTELTEHTEDAVASPASKSVEISRENNNSAGVNICVNPSSDFDKVKERIIKKEKESVLSVESVGNKSNPDGMRSINSVNSVGSVREKNGSVGSDCLVRVSSKLNEVFGCGELEVCDGMSGKKLLWNAVKWNLKHRPMGLLAGVCAFLYTFVRNYLRSNTGFAFGFTGPDGVGKTTVIELLIARLGDVFRTAHSYMHFRPMLFGNLGEVAHSAGLKKEVDREYTKPHRGGRVGVVSSLVRLAYYSVDYIVGYWLRVKSQIRITRLVIFDRYYTDVICDSRRSRIFLNYKFLYWFGWVFVPRLDYNVLLTARTETILVRKRELTEEGIRAINERIEFLATKRGYRRFVNEGTAEEMVTEILEWVFEEQHKRNMKRIL